MATTRNVPPVESTVVGLNRSAICLLMARGDKLQEALLNFSKALKLLEEVLPSNNGPYVPSPNFMSSHEVSTAGFAADRGNQSSDFLSKAQTSSSLSSPKKFLWDAERGVNHLANEQLFVYNQPIEISEVDNPSFCRAALLFNASLTQHSLGLTKGDSATLRAALMLYASAFQSFQALLFYNCLLNNATNEDAELRIQVYLLAAWNNQATIHLVLHKRASAKEMLKEQKAMLMDLYQKQTSRAAAAHKSREEGSQVSQLIQAFLMNEFMVEIIALSAAVA